MDEVILTSGQWEKISKLSISAVVAFFAMRWGLIERAAYYACYAGLDEIEQMDWLGYLAGISDEEAATDIWQGRATDVVELMNEWLTDIELEKVN